MSRVIVTKPFCGLLYMQVCACKDATDEEILVVCNRENPAGTSLGWANVIRSAEEKEKLPVQCADDSERMHFLVNC